MSYRRETRASKSGLFDEYNSLEEGGLRASSSYSSDISEHENDKALDTLKNRVFFLKQNFEQKCNNLKQFWRIIGRKVLGSYNGGFGERKWLSGDIHDEVLNHNRVLDRMRNEMDASRGILSGTLDRFKMVFERKSGRAMCKLVGFLVAFFLLLYYLIRVLRRSM